MEAGKEQRAIHGTGEEPERSLDCPMEMRDSPPTLRLFTNAALFVKALFETKKLKTSAPRSFLIGPETVDEAGHDFELDL
jgi:hypothetical protein